MMRIGYVLTAVAVALAGLAAPALAQEIVFGPETFELTEGEMQSLTAVFSSESEGEFRLYLRNGDGESGRVSGGSVALNGAPVSLSGALGEETDGLLAGPVQVQSGENELLVELEGRPGSFVTILVATPEHPPLFASGRLVLPWGRNDDESLLRLALKNDSRQGPRLFVLQYYNPAGDLVAKSQKMPLPPQGSLAFGVGEVMAQGDWERGSIEVIYAGPGRGRLLGSAQQVDLAVVPLSSIEPLVQAGYGISEEPPQPPDPPQDPIPWFLRRR